MNILGNLLSGGARGKKLGAALSTTSLVAMTVSLCPLAPAMAQTVEPQAAGAQQTEDDSNAIIVTARKRDEQLFDVPLAVNAFTGADLDRSGLGTIEQVAERTPQLVIGTANTPTGGVINMRGIGSADTTPSIDQSVSINIDGVQVSQATAITLGMYDLNRVEVLKGPQALFFGKSSPAGVISLVSADPGETLEWRARAGYETESARRLVEGMFSTPITDSLGFRIAGAYSTSDGWFRNPSEPVPGGVGATQHEVPSIEEYFVRGTLQYAPLGGRLDATLKIAYNQQTMDNSPLAGAQIFACPLGVPQGSFGVPGGSTDCTIDRNTLTPDISPAAAALAPQYFRDGRPYSENEQFLPSLTANLAMTDHLTLTSVTGYFDSTVDWSGTFNSGDVERLVTASHTDISQFTQEFRLASSFDSPLNFVVGAFYQNASLRFSVPAVLAGPIANAFFGSPNPALFTDDTFQQDTEAYSLFGQGIWTLSDEWEITAGARYSHEAKTGSGVRNPSIRSGFTTLPLPFAEPNISFNDISPEVTVRYQPNSDFTLYAAYRTGFTSGGYNLAPIAFSTSVPNDNRFDQASAEGGEIGVKAALADNQLRFDLNIYSYDYEDLQLSALVPGTVTLSIQNAGSATAQGVELSTTYSPNAAPGLTLRSDIAYNDASYNEYTTAGCYTGQTIALGCNGSIVGGVANTQDLSGVQLERAPEWTASLGVEYETAFVSGTTLTLTADENYISSYFSDAPHDPRSVQDEAWRLNASATIRAHDDRWELGLIGRNLTNELRALRSSNTPFTGFGTGTAGPALLGDMTGTVSIPRSIMLQLTLRNAPAD